MTMPRFHLAFPVRDLAEARRFYGELLGCPEGRSSPQWVDFDFYGHQIVAHLCEPRGDTATNEVDGENVPVRHFGVILGMSECAQVETGDGFVVAVHGGSDRSQCRAAVARAASSRV